MVVMVIRAIFAENSLTSRNGCAIFDRPNLIQRKVYLSSEEGALHITKNLLCRRYGQPDASDRLRRYRNEFCRLYGYRFDCHHCL